MAVKHSPGIRMIKDLSVMQQQTERNDRFQFNYKGFTFNINLSLQLSAARCIIKPLVDKIENVNLLHTNADERVLDRKDGKQPRRYCFF
jgi:hypothetical protein